MAISGSLKITGYSDGSYQCTLIDWLGVLSEIQQNKSILDIEKFKGDVAWENSADFDPETSPYCCFPISNLNFFKDKGVVITRTEQYSDPEDGGKIKSRDVEYELLTWLYYLTSSGQVNFKNPDGTIKAVANTINASVLKQSDNSYDTGVVNVVSPFFFLNWVIKESLKSSQFFVNENFMDDDDDLKRVCIYNNFDLTKTVFEAIPGTAEEWNNFDWGIDDDGFLTGSPGDLVEKGVTFNQYVRSYPELFKITNHLPKMTLGELLVSTQNLFNLVIDFLPNNVVNIYSRDGILKAEAIDVDKFAIGEWQSDEKKNVTLKFSREHDSNDLVFSEYFTDLSDRKTDIKDPVASWDELIALPDPEEGEIRLIRSSQQYAEYKWYTPEKVDDKTMSYTTTDVLGWKVISIGLQNGWHEYGRDEQEEIETKWSTCFGYGDVIRVLQQGNMNAWKAKDQAFSPRLLIYRGNNTGGIESETLSLDYEKIRIGLFERFWKNTRDWWANALPATRSFDFPVNMLKYILYNKCKKFRTKEGEFMIDELRCTLYLDHISETTIKGYKV